MRAVVQRVSNASVKVGQETVGDINSGLLVLLAIHIDDTEYKIKKMADKLINLRVFEDEDKKMNLSVKDIKGNFLIVSQFTLYGDVKRGNRPSFIESARPEKAEPYYEKLVKYIREKGFKVDTGKFGNLMEVDLINYGPTTIIIDV